jgi:flagellar hook protein FlgE
MIDSIFIGTSGLQAFSEGLKVIGNNVANLNTPGFKASDSVFSNLYAAQGGSGRRGDAVRRRRDAEPDSRQFPRRRPAPDR